MKIIKEGTLPFENKIAGFQCYHCGCVWIAEEGEFGRRPDGKPECDCPACGFKVGGIYRQTDIERAVEHYFG